MHISFNIEQMENMYNFNLFMLSGSGMEAAHLYWMEEMARWSMRVSGPSREK